MRWIVSWLMEAQRARAGAARGLCNYAKPSSLFCLDGVSADQHPNMITTLPWINEIWIFYRHRYFKLRIFLIDIINSCCHHSYLYIATTNCKIERYHVHRSFFETEYMRRGIINVATVLGATSISNSEVLSILHGPLQKHPPGQPLCIIR